MKLRYITLALEKSTESLEGKFRIFRRCVTVAYFLHELLADDAEVLRESGAEHHDLLLRRRHLEDLLRVAAQIYKIQQLSGTIIVVNLH